MKSNAKSSITLPPSELRLVNRLQKTLKAKSKVEVIRRGLTLLAETTDREALRNSYRLASNKVRPSHEDEMRDLDGLSDDGLDQH